MTEKDNKEYLDICPGLALGLLLMGGLGLIMFAMVFILGLAYYLFQVWGF